MPAGREDYKAGYNDAITDVLAILRDVENESERQRALTKIAGLRLHR